VRTSRSERRCSTAEIVNNDELGVEQPEHEAHRNYGDRKARDVNPIVFRRHPHGEFSAVITTYVPSPRNATGYRASICADVVTTRSQRSLVGADEGLRVEVRNREIRGERQTIKLKAKVVMTARWERALASVHLMFMAVFAASLRSSCTRWTVRCSSSNRSPRSDSSPTR